MEWVVGIQTDHLYIYIYIYNACSSNFWFVPILHSSDCFVIEQAILECICLVKTS